MFYNNKYNVRVNRRSVCEAISITVTGVLSRVTRADAGFGVGGQVERRYYGDGVECGKGVSSLALPVKGGVCDCSSPHFFKIFTARCYA